MDFENIESMAEKMLLDDQPKDIINSVFSNNLFSKCIDIHETDERIIGAFSSNNGLTIDFFTYKTRIGYVYKILKEK